jgi:hypothetical protein
MIQLFRVLSETSEVIADFIDLMINYEGWPDETTKTESYYPFPYGFPKNWEGGVVYLGGVAQW